MKTKNSFYGILTLMIILFLISGFKVSDNKIINFEETVNIEEVYAGPCGRRGCDGQPTYCTSYVAFEIGGITIIRHCEGIKSDTGDKEIEAESV